MLLWPYCSCSTTFYFCFLYFPRYFYCCCSTLSCSTLVSSLLVLIFYRGWHGLIGLAPLLPLLGPMGLTAAISHRAGVLGLIFFSLSFQAFTTLCFFLLLTNLFLHPFLLVTGIFYCWAPFIKSGDQQPLRRKHSIAQSYLNSSIIIVDYVKSNDNLADPFIKALAKDRV